MRKVHLCASKLNHSPGPLTQFTDDEIMMKETGKCRFVRVNDVNERDKRIQMM